MKSRFLAAPLLTALLAASLAMLPAVAAADPPIPIPAFAADRSEGEAFALNGRVESIDYARNVVVVRARGERVSIAVTPTTSFDAAGEVGSIADLRPGVRVHVKGSVVDGAMIAEIIVIK